MKSKKNGTKEKLYCFIKKTITKQNKKEIKKNILCVIMSFFLILFSLKNKTIYPHFLLFHFSLISFGVLMATPS
jgi:hypothetical protein